MCSRSWPEQDDRLRGIYPARCTLQAMGTYSAKPYLHVLQPQTNISWEARGIQINAGEFLGLNCWSVSLSSFLSSLGAGVSQDRSQCTPTLPFENKSPLPHRPSGCKSGVWETTTHGPNVTSPCILKIKCGWNISYGRSVAAFKPQCKSGAIVRETMWISTPNRKSLQKTLQKSLCRSLF